MPDTTCFELLVAAPQGGQRLDRFVGEQVAGLSRSAAQRLIDGGQVQVDGQAGSAARKLRPGQRVRVTIPPDRPSTPQAENIALDVLYEDADLIVVNKAAGMVVHPAAGHSSGTLVNALLGRYGDAFSVGGEQRPGIVHRLDKGTSGALVVARHDRALRTLQAAFKQREVEKTYLAVVSGDPGSSAELDTPYGRHPTDRKRYTSRRARDGRRARLRYQRIELFANSALVQIELGTGRTHQIRVQLADRGHALLGDPTYARGAVRAAFARPALHAWKLCFVHPMRQQRVECEAPLPRDLQELLHALRERPA